MSSSNFFVQRLKAPSLSPTSFDNNTKLMKLFTVPANLTSPTNPEIAMIQQFTSAFRGGNLAFTDSATLWLYGANVPPIWQSPFCKSSEVPGAIDLVVSAANQANPNSSIFNDMLGANANSTFYVSPKSASWILQISNSNMTGAINSFSIFFNPIKNITPADIPSVISGYCNMISNADPICFCQNDTDICAYGVVGSSELAGQLQQNKPDDYNTLKANCAFLSPICNQWQPQVLNAGESSYIASQIAAGSASSICGATFNYSTADNSPVAPSTNNDVVQQCGLTASENTSGGNTPSPTPSPSPPPATSSTSKTKMYVIIVCVVVVLLVLIGVYYL